MQVIEKQQQQIKRQCVPGLLPFYKNSKLYNLHASDLKIMTNKTQL